MTQSTFHWLEFNFRPKKEGLHDSGYRFIRLVAVTRAKQGGVTRTPLHQWADHVVLNGPVNIDVEANGTIRIMPWDHPGWTTNHDDHFYSSAMFDPVEGSP